MTPPDEEPINAYPTDEFRLPTRSRGPFLVALGVFSTVLLGAFVVLGSSEREVEVPVPAASSLPSALVPAPREDPPVVPAETPVPVGLDAPDIDADDHAHSGEVAPEAGDAPRGDAQRASRRARMRRDEVATAASITEVASADPAAPKEDDEEEVREAPLVSVAGAVMPSVRAGSHAPIMVNVVGGGMAVTTAAPSATSDVEHTEGTHGPMVAVRTHGR
jgi:hypothetical protein